MKALTDVVVLVAGPVVDDELRLHRLLGGPSVDDDATGCATLAEHRHFQCAKCPAGVAVAARRDELGGVGMKVHLDVGERPGIGDDPCQQGADVVLGDGLESKHRRAAEQCAVQRKGRVLGRCADSA